MPSVRAVLAGVNPSLRQCLGWGHNGNSGLCQAEDKDWLSSIDRCEPLRHTVCEWERGRRTVEGRETVTSASQHT